MARDGNLRIGDVVAELVRRGIPRSDAPCEGPARCWWISHPQEMEHWPSKTRPLAVLGYCNSDLDELHDVQLAVSTCKCCEVIVSTELVDSDGFTFAAMPYWPGLDRVERIWRQMRKEWQLELERYMARENS